MIIEGSQYTDPRSAMRSTQVLPAASGLSGGGQTLLDSWNVDNVSTHAECVLQRDASSLRGEYKHCFCVWFCFGLSLKMSIRKGVFSSAASQHISRRPCGSAVTEAYYVNIQRTLYTCFSHKYASFCRSQLQWGSTYWHNLYPCGITFDVGAININTIVDVSITDTAQLLHIGEGGGI